MELPAYHIPSAKTVLLHVWERLKGFIIKAGTILFLACVVMWFLSSFGFVDGGFGLVEESADSILAMLGGAIAIPVPSAWFRRVAAGCSFHHWFHSKRGYRFHHGCSGECIRGSV